MVRGKRLAEWDQTAALLAAADGKGKHPNEYHPYRRKRHAKNSELTPGELRAIAESMELAKKRQQILESYK